MRDMGEEEEATQSPPTGGHKEGPSGKGRKAVPGDAQREVTRTKCCREARRLEPGY